MLERLIELYLQPEVIVVDNGPEFGGAELDTWAHQKGIRLHFITPGKPGENAYIDRLNGKFRDECLNESCFLGLEDARTEIAAFRTDTTRSARTARWTT